MAEVCNEFVVRSFTKFLMKKRELFNALTTKKQMTKFSSANFQKNVKSKLYQIENSKMRGQTV